MENISDSDRTWATPLWEMNKGGGKGGGRGVRVTGWWALRGALDRMSTGCYMLGNRTPIKNIYKNFFLNKVLKLKKKTKKLT